jgi:DHA1 family inner membrane transport protein
MKIHSLLSSPLALPLLALALGSFVVGSSEFIIMGLLPEVAADLHISVADAGLIVSAYAMGVVIGAPLIGPLLGRMPQRTALLWLTACYALGNLGCALAPDYYSLMLMRLITAFCHAGYFGCATLFAVELSPLHRRASAMSLVLSGLTIANVLGVPLGAWLGQAFTWRFTFAAVAVIGVIAWLAQWMFLPEQTAKTHTNKNVWSGIFRFPVQHALLTCSLASIALFSVFTFISPLLRDVSHFSTSENNLILLIFGIGLTIGNLLGGRLADKGMANAVPLALVTSTICLIGCFFFSQYQGIVIGLLFVWGICCFAVASPLQLLLVEQAGESANLAATLSHAAFNLGNASGAWFGAIWLSRNYGLENLPLFGAGLFLFAALVASQLPALHAVKLKKI